MNEYITLLHEILMEAEKNLRAAEITVPANYHPNPHLYHARGYALGLREAYDLLTQQVAKELTSRPTCAHQFELKRYREAVLALLNADHHDHFASRMSDSELEAIELMKSLVAWEEFKGAGTQKGKP